ncbi:hypothetical protein FisN_8Lu414 [Fistulifera solaris]|uniref:HSF-type DNA-binding domain-containing protein n=1 Tax=Fistulifera solaris TaxID=1519565 RepID=A0A1Z5JHY2_FISSO|nr:hypothetical protein FisN_8Lu414 [Fistulifera solaris]|eukprot:GAX13371.1 hypothetical protein FisN_8Lu414 [Fistulifera solaris]
MTNFPAKLHYLLGEMEKDGQNDIMSWQSDGLSFVVHDKARLEEHILPQWYRQSHYSSFQRQLNIYGFQRISKGVHKGGYKHEFFQRDKPELCANIPRCRKKGRVDIMKQSNITRNCVGTKAEASIPRQQKFSSRSCNENVGSGSSTDRKSSSILLNDYIGALYGLANCQQAVSRNGLMENKTEGHPDFMQAKEELYATSSSLLDRFSDSSE